MMTMIDDLERDQRHRVKGAGVEMLEALGALDDLHAMIDTGEVTFEGKDRLI